MLAYDRLTVRVEPAAEPGRYEVFVNGESGEGHGEFAVPFEGRDVENFVLRMSRGRRATRRIETSDAVQAKEFGRRLFEALFQGEVRDVYRSCLADARRSDHGLRVTLALTKAPALMDLPWEYLYDEPDFLAASVWTPVVRYLDVARPAAPLAVPPPLRVLGMISRASDLPELDVEGERRQLEAALRPLTRRGRMEVHWTQAATLESLLRKLRAGDFHIFHFVGHGAYDEARGDGLLLLQGEDGRSVEVTGERLARILNDHHPMRLAVLNACEGARASDNDPFAGVAASLVQRGLPAVVAMQFEITDAAAITFARHFYSALALGYPVDAATAQARQGIYAAGNDVEWGTPVLFLRPADGRIFDLKWEDARSENPSLSASLEAQPTEAAVGEPVTWSLYVENTGMPSLFRATPEDADGEPLCEPTDLMSGENVVFTWDSVAAAEHDNAVTVVAATADGTEVRAEAQGRLELRGLEPEILPEPDPVTPDEPVAEPIPDPVERAQASMSTSDEPARRDRSWIAAHRVVLAGVAIAGVLLVAAALLLSGGDETGGGSSSSGQGGGGTGPKPIQLADAPNGMAVVDDSLLWVSTRAGTYRVAPDGSVGRPARAATNRGSAISARDAYLWVLIPKPNHNQVVQLDAHSGKKLGVIPLEGEPKAIALSPESVYVFQRDATRTWVQRYDADTRTAEPPEIDVPNGTKRLSVRAGTLWVLVQDPGAGPDHIARFNATTGAEQPPASVGSGASATTYKGSEFWVTNADSKTVTRVDAETLKTTARIPVKGRPANVRVDGDGAVWVTNPKLPALQRIDPQTLKVDNFKVGPRPYSLAITTDGVWVGDSENDNIRLFEP